MLKTPTSDVEIRITNHNLDRITNPNLDCLVLINPWQKLETRITLTLDSCSLSKSNPNLFLKRWDEGASQHITPDFLHLSCQFVTFITLTVHTSKEKHKWVWGLQKWRTQVNEESQIKLTKKGDLLNRICWPYWNALKPGFHPYIVVKKPSLQSHLLLGSKGYFEHSFPRLHSRNVRHPDSTTPMAIEQSTHVCLEHQLRHSLS